MTDSDPARPRSKSELFVVFSLLALQGFGGVLAIVQRALVEERHWLTREEFLEDWAVAQILPGPNVVNLSLMIGDRYFGMGGALAALAGMLTFPLVIVLTIAALLSGVSEVAQVQGALRGLGAVAAGLIVATGLKLMGALRSNVLGMLVCTALAAITFIAVAWLRMPLVWAIAGFGGLACCWAYQKLGAP